MVYYGFSEFGEMTNETMNRKEVLTVFNNNLYQCLEHLDANPLTSKSMYANYVWILINYPRLQSEIYSPLIDLQIQGTIDDKQNSTQTIQVIMILMILVSSGAISILFPIYYKIQKQKDVIYQLFATIPREKLEHYKFIFLQKENVGLDQLRFQYLENNLNAEQMFKSRKKKSISQISQTKKFSLHSLYLAILILCFLLLYPIVIYVITTKLLNDFSESGKS